MAITINASTSSGLIQTADTSGIIQFQSNGSTKATISSSGFSYPGAVLQVVSTTKTDTFSTATSVTAGGTAVTGMAATITPTSASNKILILFDGNTGSGPNTDQSYFFIKRNGTTVLPATVATGTQVNINTRTYTYSDGNIMYPVSWSGLDSPASTSALTYQVFLAGQGAGTVYFNRTAAFRDHPDGSPTSSTITLMEIAV